MANGNFGGGTGTLASPYLIEDQADLFAISSRTTSNFAITKNITLTSPVPEIPLFTGTIDGRKNTITNFSNAGNAWFQRCTHATIKNIIFHNPTINKRSGNCALIAAFFNSSNLSGIDVTGTVSLNNINNTGNLAILVYNTNPTAVTPVVNTIISNCNILSTNSISTQCTTYIFGDSSLVNYLTEVRNCTNHLNINHSSSSSSSSGYVLSFSNSYAYDSINYGDFSSSARYVSIYGIAGFTAIRCTNYGNLRATYVSSSDTTTVSGISFNYSYDCVNHGDLYGTRIGGIAVRDAYRSINYGTLTAPSSYSLIGGISSARDADGYKVVDCVFAGKVSAPAGTSVYYGNRTSTSQNNVNLKVLDTSTTPLVTSGSHEIITYYQLTRKELFSSWDYTRVWYVQPDKQLPRLIVRAYTEGYLGEPLQHAKNYMLVKPDSTGTMNYSGVLWKWIKTIEQRPSPPLTGVAGTRVTYSITPFESYIDVYDDDTGKFVRAKFIASGLRDPLGSGGYSQYTNEMVRSDILNNSYSSFINFYYVKLSDLPKDNYKLKIQTPTGVVDALTRFVDDSPIKIHTGGGEVVSVPYTDIGSEDATDIHVSTPDGIKALRKYYVEKNYETEGDI